MKKIAILLAATMAFAINSNAQSMQSGYQGHVEAGYSVGIGDYDFGRFEVNTTHGYQVNPYIFLGAGTGLHFMSSYKTGDMEIPLDVRDSKVDIPVFANFRSNFTKGKISPFFDIKGGTFVTNNGGLYVVASLGVRYALNSKQGLSLSVGYAAEKLEFETFERFNGRYDMSYTRKPATYDTESVSVKLGFDFKKNNVYQNNIENEKVYFSCTCCIVCMQCCRCSNSASRRVGKVRKRKVWRKMG